MPPAQFTTAEHIRHDESVEVVSGDKPQIDTTTAGALHRQSSHHEVNRTRHIRQRQHAVQGPHEFASTGTPSIRRDCCVPGCYCMLELSGCRRVLILSPTP